MNKEVLFAQTLEQVRKTAKEQGNCISEEQVKEAFAELDLSNEQLQMVFDYLLKHKIGIGQPMDPDEFLTEEEKDYLQEYLDEVAALPTYSDGEKLAFSIAAMAGETDAQQRLIELHLADVAEKVYVIHRRKEFRGAAVTVAKLREKENVIFVLEHQVKEIIGEQKVTGVVLEDAAVIDVNGVFVAYGAVPQTDLLKKFAVLDDSGYVRAGETGETALEGLYVAGDARTKKLRQVVTAVSDGANAATAVAEYLK